MGWIITALLIFAAFCFLRAMTLFKSKPKLKPKPKPEQNKAIESDSKYESIDGWKDDLKSLWHGGPRTIEFTYLKYQGRKERRKVDVSEIKQSGRGDYYLLGMCHKSMAQRNFSANKITTMIQEKGKRYEVYDWIEDIVDPIQD